MTLLRTTARTLLASHFVINGVKAVRNPEPFVPVAQPVTDKLVPMVKSYAPASVADYLPEDPATLVRVNGAVQALGGLALAYGRGRRLGASVLAVTMVPSTLAKHQFWAEGTPEGKAAERAAFLKSASVLGGLLVAAQDTEGRPSLAWRAQRGTRQLAKGTKQLTKGSSSLAKDTREVAQSAVAEGGLLVGAGVAQSRKAKKRAAKAAKQARKDAAKLSAVAAKEASKQVAALQKSREEAAKQREKAARKQQKRLQRRAVVGRNIRRGEN